MIVTRKHLHRRTFLKGMGAAIALPVLDSMTPAFAAPRMARRHCGSPSPTSQRDRHGGLDAGGRRPRVRYIARAETAREVPGRYAGALRGSRQRLRAW